MRDERDSGNTASPSGMSPQLRKLILRRLGILLMVASGAIMLTGLALYLALPAFSKLSRQAPESPNIRKMHRIGYAMIEYAVRNNEQLPPKLSLLYHIGYLGDFAWFEAEDIAGEVASAEDIDAGVNFVYLVEPGQKISQEKPVPVLRENRPGGLTMLVCKKGISWQSASSSGTDDGGD